MVYVQKVISIPNKKKSYCVTYRRSFIVRNSCLGYVPPVGGVSKPKLKNILSLSLVSHNKLLY